MKNNFTPGPWRIHNNIGRKSEIGVTADAAPCIIAIMGNSKEWPVKANANAKLIAAAPMLLEALQLALKCADDHGGDHFGFGEYSDIARAAIAKADSGL